MEEFYCSKDKRCTPNVEPNGFVTDERGRTKFFCKCGVCGTKKSKYVTTPIIVTNNNERNRYNFLSRL